jgi:hypothetical protein
VSSGQATAQAKPAKNLTECVFDAVVGELLNRVQVPAWVGLVAWP